MGQEYLLQVQNVTKQYGEKIALNDFSIAACNRSRRNTLPTEKRTLLFYCCASYLISKTINSQLIYAAFSLWISDVDTGERLAKCCQGDRGLSPMEKARTAI